MHIILLQSENNQLLQLDARQAVGSRSFLLGGHIFRLGSLRVQEKQFQTEQSNDSNESIHYFTKLTRNHQIETGYFILDLERGHQPCSGIRATSLYGRSTTTKAFDHCLRIVATLLLCPGIRLDNLRL